MLQAGTFLGNRYEIIGLVGSGGMAHVYKAKCHKLNRMVAIKVLKEEFGNDSDFVKRFHVEAQAAAGLLHPNIVTIYDVGEEAGLHYIVMELVEGLTLQNYIRRQGRLSPEETLQISIQIAQGLEAAHNNHTIHRDIKPQNIIVTPEGRVKVTDFGIARASNANTITMATIGSVHYFSPEQARGGYVDARSDIYSLGITMYEMVTGHVPFDGDNPVAVALMHLQDEVIPPSQVVPELPKDLDNIILRCVNKKPEFRYNTVTDMIVDLKAPFGRKDGNYIHSVEEGQKVDSPTIVMSDNDVTRIKNLPGKYDPYAKNSEYKELTEMAEEKGEDTTIFQEGSGMDPKLEKLILGLTILVGVIFALVIISMIVNTMGKSTAKNTAASSVAVTATRTTTEEIAKIEEEEKELVSMPNVVGMSKDKAVGTLQEKNLNPIVQMEASDDVEEGYVIRQSIPYGYDVEEGETVTLLVSSGREQATVPDVEGKKEAKAKSALADKGFEIITTESYSDSVDEGLVVEQSPKGGEKADYGSKVSLTISKGPEIKEVSVPSVAGKSLSEAKVILKDVGLSSGSISKEYSQKYEKGTVISQNPGQGTKLEEGGKVSLVISLGEEPKSYRYPGEVTVDCPFDEDVESGEITLVLNQDGQTKTIYDKATDVSSFPLSVSFEGFQEGGAEVLVYCDGSQQNSISVTLDKVEE